MLQKSSENKRGGIRGGPRHQSYPRRSLAFHQWALYLSSIRYSSALRKAKSHGSLGRKSYSALTRTFSSATSEDGMGGSGLRFDGCTWPLWDWENQGVSSCFTKEEAYDTLVFCLTAPIQPGWDKRGKWPTVIQLPKPATPSSFFTLQRSYTPWAALHWTVFRSQLKLDFLPHSFTLSEGFFFSLGERKATLLFHVLQAWVWVDHTAYEHCFPQHLTENSSWPHRGRSQSAFFFWFTVQSQVLPKYSRAGDVNCFLFHFTFF